MNSIKLTIFFTVKKISFFQMVKTKSLIFVLILLKKQPKSQAKERIVNKIQISVTKIVFFMSSIRAKKHYL